jgi:hypothetical protein
MISALKCRADEKEHSKIWILAPCKLSHDNVKARLGWGKIVGIIPDFQKEKH